MTCGWGDLGGGAPDCRSAMRDEVTVTEKDESHA
jgi:hypothetical protein